ncbi:MAG: hypothetical protein AB1649_06195 [Chloroflexota bacterium]
MKKHTLISIFLLASVALTACGASTPAATEAPTQPATIQPTVTAAIPQTGSGNSTEVTITLADNTIEASQTTFQAGVPYTFVINNTGSRAHNFNINPPVSMAGSLDAALDSALLVVQQEQLSAGASTTVEYTFPDTAVGQTLEFSCLIRRHYDDGMFLGITVTN